MFEIFAQNPTSLFALLAIFLLTVFSLHLRKIKLTTKMLIHISLMIALATVLQFIIIFHFPQGGSITLGSMVPILIISYRYGLSVGLLAGFLFGLINLLYDPFILHPIQVLFDYPLPYMAIGLAGLFPNNLIFSTFLAFFGRFLCHFISGVVFFSSYAPQGMSPIFYSLTVNASLIVPEAFICCVILKFLPIQRILNSMHDEN